MAKALTHILDYGPYRSMPKPQMTLSYGKCTQSPYVENDLWFVTIPKGRSGDRYSLKEFQEPEVDHTFLVGEQHARLLVMDEWKRDIDKWMQVAHKVFKGSWCVYYETLWTDVPVYKHQLPDGIAVKYGYCRTQSSLHPDRELWYVAFRGPTFVVDHICAKPGFMNRMGSDTLKWQIICWCRLEQKVEWEKLETGEKGGGYVREQSGFALDSPHLPFSVDEIEIRISTYEENIPKIIRKHKLEQNWNSMSEHAKVKFVSSWERSTGKNVLHTRC